MPKGPFGGPRPFAKEEAVETDIPIREGPIYELLTITTYPDKTDITEDDLNYLRSEIPQLIENASDNHLINVRRDTGVTVGKDPQSDFRAYVVIIHSSDRVAINILDDLTDSYKQIVDQYRDLKLSRDDIVSYGFVSDATGELV